MRTIRRAKIADHVEEPRHLRLIAWVQGRPRTAAAAFVAVLVVSIAGALGLETHLLRSDFLPVGASTTAFRSPGQLYGEDATEATLSPDDEQAILDAFDVSERLIVYVASDDSLWLPALRSHFDDLIENIGRLDGVRAVRTSRELAQYSAPNPSDGGLATFLTPSEMAMIAERLSERSINAAASRLVGKNTGIDEEQTPFPDSDPLGVAAVLQSALHRLVGSPPIRTVDGFIVSRDGQISFVLIDLAMRPGDVGATRDVVRAITSLASKTEDDLQASFPGSGYSVGVVGRPASYLAASETLAGDIRRTGAAALIVVTALLVGIFRRLRTPLLILASVLFGVCTALGVAAVIWGSISTMALIFVGAVVGLGVDFGLHVAVNYNRAGFDLLPLDRARRAVARTGRAIIFCCLTSGVAFASLATMSYPVTRQVATLAVVGLVCVAAAALVVLPAGLSASADDRSFTRSERSFVLSVPVRGTWLWWILPVAALLALPRVVFEPHPWSLAVRGNPKTMEMEQLRMRVGAAFSPVLLVSVGGTANEAVARDREALALLRPGWQRAGVVAVESPSAWSPPVEQRDAVEAALLEGKDIFARDAFIARFDRVLADNPLAGSVLTAAYRDTIASFLPQYPISPGRSGRSSVFDLPDAGDELPDGVVSVTSGYAAVSLLYLRDFPWAEGTIARVVDTCDKSGACRTGRSMLAGSAVVSSMHATVLVADLRRALILSAALVGVLLMLQARSVRLAVAALVPVCCGLAATIVLMGVARIELNMLTLSVYPLIIGLGIDDGIHIVEQFRRGETREDILHRTGPALIATTATSVAAFACLGLAEFAGVQEMGFLAAAGLAVSMLAALHLLPALLRLVPGEPQRPSGG